MADRAVEYMTPLIAGTLQEGADLFVSVDQHIGEAAVSRQHPVSGVSSLSQLGGFTGKCVKMIFFW